MSSLPQTQATRRRHFAPYLWVLPALLVYIIFKLLPMIAGVYLAFIQWDGIEPAKFVGLQNFQRMLDDEIIVLALLNTGK